MSSAFELAYARWCGESASNDVGPMKVTAASRADERELEDAFAEWEDVDRDRATPPRDTNRRCRSR
jgi:hypothetical protein